MIAIKDGVFWRPGSYCVLNVITAVKSRGGMNVQFPIVTEFDNLFDVQDALANDGSIYCAKIILDRGDDQQPAAPRRIKAVAPLILGKEGVVIIEPPYFELDPQAVDGALRDFNWGVEDEGE